jgi:hypothetical protein
MQAGPRQLEWWLERREDPLGGRPPVVGAGRAVEKHRELVAPQSRAGIADPSSGLEPSSDFLEEPVTGRVTQAVVTPLEAVQVQAQDHRALARRTDIHETTVNPIEEQRPIGEARQHVVKGDLLEPLLEHLALPDIASGEDDVADRRVVDQVGRHRLDLTPHAVTIPEAPLERVLARGAGRAGGDQRGKASRILDMGQPHDGPTDEGSRSNPRSPQASLASATTPDERPT